MLKHSSALGLRGRSTILVFALVAVFPNSGCSKKSSGFTAQSISGVQITADATRAVLQDSFERPDLINQTNGWTTYIHDALTPTTPLSSRKFGAAIFTAGQMGPAADGTKALYFFGKTGDSLSHEIYLISPAFNLLDLKSLSIAFRYLILSLNDAAESDEHLRFEVCNGTTSTCGTGSTIDPVAFRSSAWQTLFQHPASMNGSSFNGTNHLASDWASAGLEILMANYNPALPFTFRFSVNLRDGFACHKQGVADTLLDGAIIDAVSLIGTIADEGGEGPPELLPP